MIRIVIQNKFLDWIIQQDQEQRLVRDFFSFLEGLDHELEIVSDHPYPSKHDTVHPILRLMLNYNNPSYRHLDNINHIYEESFTTDCTSYAMFFLFDPDTDQVNRLTALSFEVFTNMNFQTKWHAYVTGNYREELFQPVSRAGFDSWSKLNSFKHPSNSIIICDPYLLSNRADMDTNICKLIEQLIELDRTSECKHFYIITTDGLKLKSNDYWIKAYDRLADVTKQYPNIEVSVFRYPGNLADHSRGIFTAYWYIQSGNSFNYFTDKNVVRDNIKDNISFNMTFLKRNRRVIEERLKDIELYISKSIDDTKAIGMQELSKRKFSSVDSTATLLPPLIDDFLLSVS